MNWGDTVMGMEIVSPRFSDYIPCAVWDVLEAQAEITWDKAIREVVGWIDKPCPHTGGLEEQQMRAMDCPRCWEDAKKEWGIDEVEPDIEL